MTIQEDTKIVKRKKGYWIDTDIYQCPLCFHEDRYSERVYDRPKPEDWWERNHIKQSCCGNCQTNWN